MGEFSLSLERYIKSTKKEIKEQNLHQTLKESDFEAIQIIYYFNLGIPPHQWHPDYDNGDTIIHLEHTRLIGKIKEWQFQVLDKEENKSNAEKQLDHVFGTGSGRKQFYDSSKWSKKGKGTNTTPYKFNLTGFRTPEQWRKEAIEYQKRKKQQQQKEKENNNNLDNITRN